MLSYTELVCFRKDRVQATQLAPSQHFGGVNYLGGHHQVYASGHKPSDFAVMRSSRRIVLLLYKLCGDLGVERARTLPTLDLKRSLYLGVYGSILLKT